MVDESWRRAVCGGLLLGALAGCGPGTSTTTEGSSGEGTTGTTGDEPTDASDPTAPTRPTDPTAPTVPTTPTEPDPTGDDDGGEPLVLDENREVDLLFVIDNSGSMGAEQALLSQNIAGLVDVLEAAGANYRVGVTTTDSGNPRCTSAQFKPEGGNLVLSSCLDRVEAGEFVFGVDDFSFACTDLCAKRDADLTVKPTVTEGDPQERPHNWIERSEGESNIGGVDSNVEALQCCWRSRRTRRA